VEIEKMWRIRLGGESRDQRIFRANNYVVVVELTLYHCAGQFFGFFQDSSQACQIPSSMSRSFVHLYLIEADG
jgi:hypothetical protein